MGTRSTIWVKNEDNSYTGIYCHWDGYPSHNGRLLLNHYNDKDKVEALIKLGALSSLSDSIECPEGHSFDKRVDGFTTAYHRDRGENFQQLHAENKSGIQGEDFDYVFEDGQWNFRGHGSKFTPLTEADLKD